MGWHGSGAKGIRIADVGRGAAESARVAARSRSSATHHGALPNPGGFMNPYHNLNMGWIWRGSGAAAGLSLGCQKVVGPHQSVAVAAERFLYLHSTAR